MPTKGATKKSPAQQPWPTPNPALKDLAILAGEWEMELFGAQFLPGPTDTVRGYASFAWVEDGALLEMRQGARSPNPDAVWVIGRDESLANYEALYYDSRGVSRIYAMSFEKGLWKMWRNSQGFSQRYEGRLSKDSTRIEAR